MSALCTEALNQCLNSAHLTQSILAQCSAVSAEHTAIAESHIVHATAVYSELGLAISSASLADPLAWRRTVGPLKNHQDAIERTNFLSEAKQRGVFSFAVNK